MATRFELRAFDRVLKSAGDYEVAFIKTRFFDRSVFWPQSSPHHYKLALCLHVSFNAKVFLRTALH